MKALVYTGPKRVEVRDVVQPDRPAGAAKLRLSYCGVCGTDIGIYAGKHPRAEAPLVLGHEFIGRIEDSSSDRFRPGDRVAAYPLASCGRCHPCRTGAPHVCANLRLIGIDSDGGMAETLWVDENVLFKVPDAVSDQVATLIEPLAVALRALHRARFEMMQSAVVIGAGPIGLLTAVALSHAGAGRILISDVDSARLALCRGMGFETVDARNDSLVDRTMAATDGEGADTVFECSGVASAALEMTALARPRGVLCLTAFHTPPPPVDLIVANFKELDIVASRVYTKGQFQAAVALTEDLADVLAGAITQVVPLSEAGGVFDMIADPSLNTVKILVDCQA